VLKKNLLLWCFLLVCPLQFGFGQGEDADYKMQGEYTGTLNADGEEIKYGIQVIALGEGKFTGVGYTGGLPGDGWDREVPVRVEDVAVKDGILALESDEGLALIADGVATVKSPDGTVVGQLKRVVRKSTTLGKKPPKGAVVLFDGSSTDEWELNGKPGKMTDDGLLMQGTASKKRFQNHKIHVEFLIPFEPTKRGQGRGNSGIYLQGRYEIQMLDSFGLGGEQNECGGIYSIRKPDQNMCYPPLQWQTYDIEFHAAQFDGDKKVKNAWMTVEHNGVKIHDKVELPKTTTAAPTKDGLESGFIYLQDHGNPVRYRNIWVEELDKESTTEKGDPKLP
jgi:hypothetical protein